MGRVRDDPFSLRLTVSGIWHGGMAPSHLYWVNRMHVLR